MSEYHYGHKISELKEIEDEINKKGILVVLKNLEVEFEALKKFRMDFNNAFSPLENRLKQIEKRLKSIESSIEALQKLPPCLLP